MGGSRRHHQADIHGGVDVTGLMALLATGVTSQPTPPTPPAITLDDTLNVVVDGNSYYAAWIAPAIDEVSPLRELLNNAGVTHANDATPGHQWGDMLNVSRRDSFLSPSRTNLLVVGEDRNAAANALVANPTWTAQQVADYTLGQAGRYLSRARAAGWEILKALTLPSAMMADQTLLALDPVLNEALQIVDQWWRDNWRSEGMVEIADFRAHAPELFGFTWDGSGTQGFMASTATCAALGPGGTVDRVHPIGAARTAFAGAIAAALTRASTAA